MFDGSATRIRICANLIRMSAKPVFTLPMELLSVSRLPEGPQWSYEVKLDGLPRTCNPELRAYFSGLPLH
jgi:hypothetical protein